MGLPEVSKSGVSLDTKPHFRDRDMAAEVQKTVLVLEWRNE